MSWRMRNVAIIVARHVNWWNPICIHNIVWLKNSLVCPQCMWWLLLIHLHSPQKPKGKIKAWFWFELMPEMHFVSAEFQNFVRNHAHSCLWNIQCSWYWEITDSSILGTCRSLAVGIATSSTIAGLVAHRPLPGATRKSVFFKLLILPLTTFTWTAT